MPQCRNYFSNREKDRDRTAAELGKLRQAQGDFGCPRTPPAAHGHCCRLCVRSGRLPDRHDLSSQRGARRGRLFRRATGGQPLSGDLHRQFRDAARDGGELSAAAFGRGDAEGGLSLFPVRHARHQEPRPPITAISSAGRAGAAAAGTGTAGPYGPEPSFDSFPTTRYEAYAEIVLLTDDQAKSEPRAINAQEVLDHIGPWRSRQHRSRRICIKPVDLRSHLSWPATAGRPGDICRQSERDAPVKSSAARLLPTG